MQIPCCSQKSPSSPTFFDVKHSSGFRSILLRDAQLRKAPQPFYQRLSSLIVLPCTMSGSTCSTLGIHVRNIFSLVTRTISSFGWPAAERSDASHPEDTRIFYQPCIQTTQKKFCKLRLVCRSRRLYVSLYRFSRSGYYGKLNLWA